MDQYGRNPTACELSKIAKARADYERATVKFRETKLISSAAGGNLKTPEGRAVVAASVAVTEAVDKYNKLASRVASIHDVPIIDSEDRRRDTRI